MTIEDISIQRAENGFILRISGFTLDSDNDKVWESEEFVFAERSDAVAKLTELINTI